MRSFFNNCRTTKQLLSRKTFPQILTRCTFLIEILRLSPIYPPRGAGRLSVFVCTDSFKKLNAFFFFFRPEVYFLKYLAWFNFFITLCIYTYKCHIRKQCYLTLCHVTRNFLNESLARKLN